MKNTNHSMSISLVGSSDLPFQPPKERPSKCRIGLDFTEQGARQITEQIIITNQVSL